jgi:hypothetical protein
MAPKKDPQALLDALAAIEALNVETAKKIELMRKDRRKFDRLYHNFDPEKLPKPLTKMKKGGAAFPDLTGDGKVTRADILKGRGVKGFKGGGCVMAGRGGNFKGVR